MSFDGGAYPVPALGSLNAVVAGMQLTQVFPMLEQLTQQVANLTAEIAKARVPRVAPSKSGFDEVGWLDAEGARKYLSMSKNTFEKHVYLGRIKRYLVGGKNFYKKTDLDLFVMTWEDKNLGFA